MKLNERLAPLLGTSVEVRQLLVGKLAEVPALPGGKSVEVKFQDVVETFAH
ncbi:hypothetical protein D3C80_1504740 [compost metagenome]